MAFSKFLIATVLVFLFTAMDVRSQVVIQPGGTGGNGGAGVCNFRYMLTKYNGCQRYVLTGNGKNIQNECCSPMAQVARECGACTAMMRPFTNSLLGLCNVTPCN